MLMGVVVEMEKSENLGGIGVVLVKDNKVVKEYSIPVFNTTNNRAELQAVIFAIQIAKILNKTNPREIFNLFRFCLCGGNSQSMDVYIGRLKVGKKLTIKSLKI